MTIFPRHIDNVQSGRCADCRVIALLPWHFGPLQERKLCNVCGMKAWEKLLAECGRLDEWRILVE
jgi:hypothetical protein